MSPKTRQRENLTTIYEDANDVAYGARVFPSLINLCTST